MASGRTRWLRILALATVLAIMLALSAAAARQWLLPELVRQRLQQRVGEYWDGTVEIDRLQVDTSGRIQLWGVGLYDSQHRRHAFARRADLLVRDLFGEPALTDAVVDDLELRLHRVNEEYVLPFHAAADGEGSEIRSVRVRGSALWVVDNCIAPDVAEEFPGEGEDSLPTFGGPRNFSLDITREDGMYDVAVDLLPLPPSEPPAKHPACETGGLLYTALTFHGRGPTLQTLSGHGLLEMRRVDAREARWTDDIFDFVSDKPGFPEHPARSSVEAVFSLDGHIVTVRSALLVDPQMAMRVEEGGTVDLATKQLNLYLIMVQLRGLTKLIENIPLVSLVAVISSNLTRVHVTGTWEDQVIRKEPIRDITAATKGLLLETIRLGGMIGPNVTGAFHDLFRSLEKPKPRPTPG